MIDIISIRNLQHYMYCPHRWGLIEIENAWVENVFVVKGNIIHKRAHSGDKYTSRGKKIYTDVEVWNDELGLYGKLDCLEYKDGIYTIVEYKPTKPNGIDYNNDDALQLYAQKKCFDSTMNADAITVLYYADVKERISIDFKTCEEKYENLLQNNLLEMRHYLETGIIPTVRNKQYCGGCSMKDMCMPEVIKKNHKTVCETITADLFS
jgi:CRISPR-associated exonuclease Cas4